ncbi:rod shape-determining protein MreC [Halalkalibacter nanhaiisediminis]|uniref:Cell shape-determining protein MreC n=1 Tax=Halalkalibacter nanhaiisediminis TaxID=688079 RepID=A0A562QK73_9BACI|nr:rod shape-determining protein MreC [Halalkalibacter nanhaiisediminis]TWI57105.1 rod shape-determining protein MreC [Halalkalibacter nanhaiisediminis]
MPSFFSNKKLIILLVSIIILMALIGYSLNDRERVTGPEQVVRDAVGWVQTIFMKPAYVVAGFFENVQDIQHVYEENKLLKSRLEEYAQISVERTTLRNENETLKDMLELEESLNDYLIRTAVVIHRSPDRWTEYIGLNKGSEHGVEPNMGIVDSQGGLVGKVKQVSEFSSVVQLLSDNDRTNRVSAMVSMDQPEYGFIEGYDEDRGLLIMRKLNIEAEIEEGQMVTTSGKGGVYPSGLLIGEIVQIEPDEYGLTLNAYIEPTADFQALDYVYIIERTSTSLDPALLEEDAS